jgi:hypothetical protein
MGIFQQKPVKTTNLDIDNIAYGLLPDLDVDTATDYKFSEYKASKKYISRIRHTGSIDLRNEVVHFPEVEQQLNIPSCVGCAVTSLMEFAIRYGGVKCDLNSVRLSILYHYAYARYVLLRYDANAAMKYRGATIKSGLRALNEFGWVPESWWPYIPLYANNFPPGRLQVEGQKNKSKVKYYKLETIDDIVHCLEEGWPYVFGFPTYDNEIEKSLISGIINYPEDYTKNYAGHVIIGYGITLPTESDMSDGWLNGRNSWGKAYGLGGDCSVSMQYYDPPQKTEVWKAWTVRPA